MTVHFIIDCYFAQSQVQKSHDQNRLVAAPLPFLLGLPHPMPPVTLAFPNLPRPVNDNFVPSLTLKCPNVLSFL